MNKYLFPLILTVSSLALGGCKSSSKSLEIEFNEDYPAAYVGEEYNFSDYLVVEDGINYNLEVYYQNFYEHKEYALEVSNTFYFTPVEKFELTIVVNAIKKGQQATRTATLEVFQKGDPIDELVVSDGFSGWADGGVIKELETSETYLKGENSKTSVAVHFQGNNKWVYGCGVFAINNFRLLEHWTDKKWENAILTYWVFNPTDYEIEFQLRIKDDYTGLVDVDWGNAMSISQVATPGNWTQIFFPLKKLGVTHTLFVNEEGTRNDSLTIKSKWAGTPTGDDILYDYQFYVDGLDIVPNTMYPEIDTKSYAKSEDLSYGWENMLLDSGWTSSTVLYDDEVVRTSERESKSSMFLQFDSKNANDNGYAVVWTTDELQFLPSFRHGVLKADIKFPENVFNKNLNLIAVDDGWDYIVRKEFNVTDLGDGWHRLYVDLAANPEFTNIATLVRFGFGFPGIDNSNRNTAKIFIDNIIFAQNEGTPEAEAPETVKNGWENLPIDTGWSASHQAIVEDEYKENSVTNSRTSLKSTFAGCTPKNDIGYSTVLDTESGFGSGKLPNFTSGTLEFDIKYTNNIADHDIRVEAVQDGWENYGVAVFSGVEGLGGWYHYTLNLTEQDSFSTVTRVIRIAFTFQGINDDNKATAATYLDNVVFHS